MARTRMSALSRDEKVDRRQGHIGATTKAAVKMACSEQKVRPQAHPLYIEPSQIKKVFTFFFVRRSVCPKCTARRRKSNRAKLFDINPEETIPK
eukprot:4117061-Pyramimonas_sp.AAC.1